MLVNRKRATRRGWTGRDKNRGMNIEPPLGLAVNVFMDFQLRKISFGEVLLSADLHRVISAL